MIHEADHGLEDDWVVNALIATRLLRDFEVNGARKATKAANDNHWAATRFYRA